MQPVHDTIGVAGTYLPHPIVVVVVHGRFGNNHNLGLTLHFDPLPDYRNW
jgi:hypothetical protein